MEIIIGFLIALVIGLTGVGGGVLTAPILIILLKMPAAEAVGTALVFITIVKFFVVPVYIARKQLDYRVLGYMLLGGVPGVLVGSVVLQRVNASGLSDLVLTAIGVVVLVSASLNLYRFAFHRERPAESVERKWLLAILAAGIGLEVGFSSAGAGALGVLLLLQFTTLSTAEVVGTDLLFGFVLAAVGGGFHFVAGTFDSSVVIKLASGGLVGGVLGAYLATLFPTRKLRIALAVWLVCIGSHLCYRGLFALAKG